MKNYLDHDPLPLLADRIDFHFVGTGSVRTYRRHHRIYDRCRTQPKRNWWCRQVHRPCTRAERHMVWACGEGVQRKGIASEGSPWTPRSFPHCQGPRPRARAKRRKGGDLAVTNRLPSPHPILISSPPLAIRRLAARAYVRFSATAQLSLQRWPCRPRHSCARQRRSGPRRHGPPSPPRGRCGCRRRRGAGSPRPRGSPCGSRPSRPTSAVTAGG